MRTAPSIERLSPGAYRIETDARESDGTFEWSATTVVVVEASGGGRTGVGYSYTTAAAATVIHEQLGPAVCGGSALDVPRAWSAMQHAIRNIGRPGVAASAIAAVDCALWDLKARLLDVSLVDLLGATRDDVAVYGSGGFTSYSTERLCAQLAGWAESAIPAVKMKVGRDADADAGRVAAARSAIGEGVVLMVDANGAYDRRQAIDMAHRFAGSDVRWFEEPVSSDDLRGLAEVRRRVPPAMEIAAGEYGYDSFYFHRMLQAGAVDVLQADITRCAGVTGLLRAAVLCAALHTPLSTHTAPALHLHAACATENVRHIEYFHDHARLEPLLFDGVIAPVRGRLRPDRSAAGNGLALKHADAAKYRIT
jgi:L-alanine-DL-glutamate epimerase-like enolase superfamily enzyme